MQKRKDKKTMKQIQRKNEKGDREIEIFIELVCKRGRKADRQREK